WVTEILGSFLRCMVESLQSIVKIATGFINMINRKMALAFVAWAAFAAEAYPCTTMRLPNVQTNVQMVNDADAIVRATAVEYVSQPGNPLIPATGTSNSMIRFQVLETIRGPVISGLNLSGNLVDR